MLQSFNVLLYRALNLRGWKQPRRQKRKTSEFTSILQRCIHGKHGAPAPTGQVEIPTPPIRRSTVTENYQIELNWNCDQCSQKTSMEPGKDIQFGISFFDNRAIPTQRVNYDFTVKDTNGQTVLERKSQTADSGLGFQTVKFEQGGGKVITVKINAVSGVPNDQFIETADFNVVVVPEFPISAAILAAAVIGLVIAVTRFRGTSFGSMFGGKNAL